MRESIEALFASLEKHVNMVKLDYPEMSVIGIGSLGVETALPLIEQHRGDKIRVGLIYSSFDGLTAILEKLGLKQDVLRKAAVKTLEREKISSLWPLSYENAGGGNFFKEVKRAGLHKPKLAVIVAAAYDGLSSGIACRLAEFYRDHGVKTVFFAIMPSADEPEVHMFNAYCALANLLGKRAADVVTLMSRDRLEKFEVIDAYGKPFRGLQALGVMLRVLHRFVGEAEWFAHSSKELDIRHFTPLLALSTSLEIYGSIKNMLRVAAINKLLDIELDSAQCLFVYPTLLGLLSDVTHETFIRAVTAWLEGRAKLSLIHVAEPRYVKLGFDKIDLLLLIGGFKLKDLVDRVLHEGYLKFKSVAVERKLVKEEVLRDLEEALNGYLERFS
ncbi:MAG: hypothetical protein DRJ31_04135 [Candidatus Methanomethylicota archaeon]|mgnify:CR=1 FL=1|uniref:Uncharacterized protein n=1 Tax=Thermoproteota archaeon TaxID=2056631 RepID=A0A497EQK8_9CREN|nr:MAG: hypothetical protein DRJ31_04135 [Candidatus Verstraetearchaeota archaeon]RLE53090.1 MAG: hypothetical protein DRJ33_01985 [Candidatus Verstraetearchaeota archaeon]